MESFLKSPARTVALRPHGSETAVQRPSSSYSDSPSDNSRRLCFPAKSSADLLDYTVHLGAWFGGTGDSLATATVRALEDSTGNYALSVAAIFYDPVNVTLILTSGVPGQEYAFNIEITTRMGLIFAIPLSILINEDTPASPPRSFTSPATPIDGDSLAAFLNGLPLSAPASGGWWNNAGIPTLAPKPSKTTAGKA